jgi:hypothetical protein
MGPREAAKKTAKTGPGICAKIGEMGRPRALDQRREEQLAVLLDAGLPQAVCARVFNVSRRTVCRFRAGQREESEQPTLAQLLDELEGLRADGDRARPPARRRRSAPERDWEIAARALELDAPQRWAARPLRDQLP